MKNKAMLIGAIDAGKTTLINKLIGGKNKPLKTQTLLYYDWLVDTPGEYTENPLFYKNIMATAFEVTHVLYIQDATRNKSIFPPGFSTGISKLPIAVVTKSDSVQADVNRAMNLLKKVVVKGPLLIVSSFNDTGLEHIQPLVKCNTMDEMKSYVYKHNTPLLQFIES